MSTHAADSVGAPMGMIGTPSTLVAKGRLVRDTWSAAGARRPAASGARIYDIGFADDREVALVATDGGLLEAPETLDRIQLSVGERAEIVVALEPGEDVILRSFEPEYMLHCHVLQHEDRGMMSQFVVADDER